MLHRHRSVMRDPARTCLAGTVEIIEGAHQCSFSDAHHQACLDEFWFRHNRMRGHEAGACG